MSDEKVSRPEVRKGRGNLPATHLTTGEREELRQTRELVVMRSDGLMMTFPVGGPGVMQVSSALLKNGIAEETTRQNDADSVTPERDAPYERDSGPWIRGYAEGYRIGYGEAATSVLSSLLHSGAFDD